MTHIFKIENWKKKKYAYNTDSSSIDLHITEWPEWISDTNVAGPTGAFVGEWTRVLAQYYVDFVNSS